MRLLADEHVPPAIVAALRGEGHDVAVVGDAVPAGSADRVLVDFARDTNRLILSQDADFRGGEPALNDGPLPGVLACETGAQPGAIAAAIRRIEMYADDLTDTVLFVPGAWV